MNRRIQCNVGALALCLGNLGTAFAQPHITTQPADQSVSLGANVTEQVFASGIAPLSYQWHFNDAESAGEIKRTLVLTNVQVVSSGGYSVVVTDTSGSVTSLVARVEVDPTFTMITTGEIVTDAHVFESIGCSWVDFDNDGYLDLFVININENNALYHNNRNGTFTKINAGSLVNDCTINSVDAAWADHDNDGFMDVFHANIDSKNSLFHNNGNSNHWINFELVGTASNRSAIGAKVRVKATIGGKTFWQRRDIAGGGSQEGQSDIRASFGLGDATNIDTVRIEWPSGTVQELRNVASKQFLIVTEPARLKGSLIGGQYQLVLNGGIGFTYDMQASMSHENLYPAPVL